MDLHEVFQSTTDLIVSFYGGIACGKLCNNDFKQKMAGRPFLISFEKGEGDENHISTEYYISLIENELKTRDIICDFQSMVSVFAFEKVRALAEYEKIKTAPAVLFLFHLRNSGAHGNKFHFRYPNGKVKDPGTVKWRSKLISLQLEGKKVFPDFFGVGEFPHLFEDISRIIREVKQ